MTATTQTLKNDDSTSVGSLYVHSLTSPVSGIIGATVLATVSGTTATDVSSSNPLPISDAGGSITIDSTVLDSIDTAVNGTLTVGSHAVTNAGTFAVQVDGAALTSLQLLDDAVYTDGSGTPSKGIAVMGTDGTNPQLIAVDSDGNVQVDIVSSVSLTVDGSGVTQPISAASLPLPSGAATAANQTTGNSSLATIAGAVSGTEVQVDIVSGTVTANLGATDNAVLDTIASPVSTISATPLQRVAIFDASDTQITSFGGGTQYAVDTALGATPTGTLAVAIRDDALSALTPVEGDAVGLRVDANGGLWITPSGTVTVDGSGVTQPVSGTVTANLSATDNAVLDSIDAAVNGTLTVGSHAVTNAGTFAVQVDGDALTALQLIDDAIFADDAAFTLTTSKVAMAGAIRDDTLSALTAIEGDAVPLRVNSTGALHVTGAGGGTQYNVDDPSGGTDTGTMALAVRDDSLTTLTPADGDYVPLRVSSTGALHVTGGGGGTEYSEDVATPATIVGTATMMERDDALSGVTPIEGDWLSLRGTAEGALWVQDFNSDSLVTNTGTIAGDTTSIDGKITACDTGAVVIASGTVTANLSATDNAVLDTIATNTTDAATQTTLASALTSLQLIDDPVATISATPLQRVAIFDASDTQITSFGGGTEYTEDAAAAANPVGNALILVREDARAGSLTTTDGDNVALRGNNKGEAYVIDTDANASLSTIAGDTTSLDGKITTCDTTNVQIASGTVTTVSTVTNLSQLGGAAVSMGTGVRDSGTQRVTIATNDVVPISDNGGSITVDGTVGVSGTVTVDLGSNNDVQGQVAHDAAVSGNPVHIGAEARSTDNTAVGTGDAVRLMSDLVGKLVNLPYSIPENMLDGTGSATGTSNTAVIAAQGAGVRIFVTSFQCANSSATDVLVDIKDGTTTLLTVPVPAAGGCMQALPVPLRLTANTALNFASKTSATTVYCSAQGYKGV